jgi:hypothetical protein
MARPKKKPVDNIVQVWLEEIADSRKRDKDYRKDGQTIIDTYAGDKIDETPFNILFSNTETLLPALYSQAPRPVVEQKHKKKNDVVGQMAAEAAQKLLEYLIDTNLEGYETYSEAMHAATLDALLPGRAITAIKYDAPDDVAWELVCPDSKKWDRVYFGYATKWEDVPWLAYELFIDKDEAKKLFDDKAEKLNYTENEESDEEEDERNAEEHQGNRKTCCVYQIWDKDSKTIKYISPNYKDGILLEIDDPLGISGFFNCPKPLQFIVKPGSLSPKAPFKLYENQAKELNRITRRLNRVIEAIKVRGVYDGNFGDDLKNIFDEDDNGLSPTEKGGSLIDGSFDKSIWLMPVEKLVQVAMSLYQAREACKQVIYEITGISDVIRGSSKASETLGAQKIKEGWGSMRLKRMQKAVQEYSRSTLRIMLEVAIQKFSSDSWAKMTGLDYPTAEQKQKAQEMIKNFQMQSQQVQQQAQMSGQPPQPPPPQMQQQVQQAQKIVSTPSWDDVLEVLKDDYQRSYRIDIETNSTLDVEATEDKQLISEFMNAMAQLMNGVAPMVKEGIMPFEAMKSMLLEVAQRFRFGRNVQEEINAMQPPKQPNVEAMQKQMEEQKKQMEQAGQKIQQEGQRVEQEKQALMQEKQSLEVQKNQEMQKIQENARKVSQQLEDEARKIEEARKEWEFEKKLFLKEIEYLKKLDDMEKKFVNDKQKMELTNIIQKQEAKEEAKETDAAI